MGGAEAVLCDLIHSMDKNLFDHTVLYVHDGPHTACLKALGVPHYQVRGLIWQYDPIFIMRLLQLVKQIRPNVIHTLLWAANVAGRIVGKMLRIPVVSAWHNNLDQDGLIRIILDRLTYRMAVGHIAVSQGVLESAQRLGFKANNAQVISNGIAVDRIQEASKSSPLKRSDLAIAPEEFVIGSVGRFVPVKRLDLMVGAFSLLCQRHKHVRLILVGAGDQEAFLRERVHALGVAQKVIFIVGQSSYRYYPLFDCFSLSSDKEGISIALLEAMSFRLPCVMTYAEDRHAVIEQGVNGVLVPAGNASALALAWERIMTDRAKARALLGNAAYDVVQSKFSSTRMCAEYGRFFKKAVDSVLHFNEEV